MVLVTWSSHPLKRSAGNLSFGPRESGMISSGRSVVSPELLEVGVCAVIPRGRRTPVDVRRRDCWVEDGKTMQESMVPR